MTAHQHLARAPRSRRVRQLSAPATRPCPRWNAHGATPRGRAQRLFTIIPVHPCTQHERSTMATLARRRAQLMIACDITRVTPSATVCGYSLSGKLSTDENWVTQQPRMPAVICQLAKNLLRQTPQLVTRSRQHQCAPGSDRAATKAFNQGDCPVRGGKIRNRIWCKSRSVAASQLSCGNIHDPLTSITAHNKFPETPAAIRCQQNRI